MKTRGNVCNRVGRATAFMVSVGVLGTTTASQIASAQTAAAAGEADTGTSQGPFIIDEIVVTAQFREQRLQDTPLAVTAISADQLDARGQVNLADIGTATPNLTIKKTGDAFGPAVAAFIRGIGQSDSNFALEPGVGIYVDDIYYSTVFGTTFDLLDLDRIEVLRGPQGTLAGKNSIGGAVKLYSNMPDEKFAGFGDATTGSFDRIDLRGSVNIPIIADQLALRLSAVRNESDGYVTRYDYGCLYPDSGVPAVRSGGNCKLGTSGGRESSGARGTLAWSPSESVKLTIIADYSEDNSPPPATIATYIEGRGRTFLNGTPFDSRFVTAGTYTSYATYSDPGGVYVGVDPATGQTSVQVVQPSGIDDDPQTELRDWGVSAHAVIDLTPDLVLTSITGYRGYDGKYAFDADATPFNYQITRQESEHEQVSQELRLTGRSFDSALDWTVGAFYFDEDNVSGGRTQIPSTVDTLIDDQIDSQSYSAFVHSTVHVTDRFDLTGGLRYSDDEKTYLFNRSAPEQASINGRSARYAGDRLDYKLNASYSFTPDVMSYAQFSTGYRAGGTNPRPFSANQVISYDPETLDAYEIGLKTAFFDRKLTLNLSGFVNDYADILVSSTSPFTNPDQPIDNDPDSPNYNPASGTNPSFVILNSGKARLKGVEAEVFILPLPTLRVEISASYLDFEYTQLDAVAAASGLTEDSALPYAPEWKWSVGVENHFSLGGFGALIPRVDVNFQDDISTSTIPTAYTNIEAYTLTNLRLTWLSPDEDWQVAATVNNAFDKYYYLTKFETVSQSGTATAQPGRPREWMLMLRRTF